MNFETRKPVSMDMDSPKKWEVTVFTTHSFNAESKPRSFRETSSELLESASGMQNLFHDINFILKG